MALTCPNCSTRFKVKSEALGDRGRSVRCAKCAHVWFATQDDLEPDNATGGQPAPKAPPRREPPPREPPPRREPEPEDDDPFGATFDDGDDDADDVDLGPPPPSMRSESPAYEAPPFGADDEIVPRQRRPQPKKKSPLGAWIVLGVLVLGVAIGGFFLRFDIVKAYRPANAIFAAIGFPVDTLGFGLKIEQPTTRALIKQDERVLEVTGGITNTSGEPIDVPLLRGALLNAQDMEVHVWSFGTESRACCRARRSRTRPASAIHHAARRTCSSPSPGRRRWPRRRTRRGAARRARADRDRQTETGQTGSGQPGRNRPATRRRGPAAMRRSPRNKTARRSGPIRRGPARPDMGIISPSPRLLVTPSSSLPLRHTLATSPWPLLPIASLARCRTTG